MHSRYAPRRRGELVGLVVLNLPDFERAVVLSFPIALSSAIACGERVVWQVSDSLARGIQHISQDC